MKTSLTRSTYTELPTHPLSVSIARTYVARILADWGRAELSDDAQLVVSELLTNAIKATQAAHTPNDEEPMVHGKFAGYECHPWIGLHQWGNDLVVEVWDCNHHPPKLRAPESWEAGGRGLQVIDSLAVSWGYRWPKTGGKIVWATLAMSSSPA
ncbi:ATP-binding protein [Nonomuraea cavernae]|uniref:ATP-binding protein n=1 Tax=Nonomuraea cavernae TaxID=2045107 RepID=UPI0033D69D21